MGLPDGSDGKESACSVGDLSSISALGISPGGGHGNLFQYSCLENPHTKRSLAGCSPWDLKESDTTERLSTAQHSPIMTLLFLQSYQTLQICLSYSHPIPPYSCIFNMRFKNILAKVESFNACWCSYSNGFTNFLLLFYNDPYIGLIYLEMVVTTAADLSPWSISDNSTFSCYIRTFLCFLGHFQHHWWHFVQVSWCYSRFMVLY